MKLLSRIKKISKAVDETLKDLFCSVFPYSGVVMVFFVTLGRHYLFSYLLLEQLFIHGSFVPVPKDHVFLLFPTSTAK